MLVLKQFLHLMYALIIIYKLHTKKCRCNQLKEDGLLNENHPRIFQTITFPLLKAFKFRLV